MKVRLTRRAEDDLGRISAVLEPYGLDYEERVIRAIQRRFQSLASFPDRGSTLTLPNGEIVRKAVVGSYIIPYRVADRTVLILAIVHGARDVPSALGGLPPGDE
jgi:plasmid stabilization system protein ParE